MRGCPQQPPAHLLPYGAVCSARRDCRVGSNGACSSWCRMPCPWAVFSQNARCICSREISSLVGGAASSAAGARSRSEQQKREVMEGVIVVAGPRKRTGHGGEHCDLLQRTCARVSMLCHRNLLTRQAVLLEQLSIGVQPLPRRRGDFLHEQAEAQPTRLPRHELPHPTQCQCQLQRVAVAARALKGAL